jgi:hypothetical protein
MDAKELEQLRQDPAAAYASPEAVLRDHRLSQYEKLSILEAWELDARRLAESTSQGMDGGEETHLRDVAQARLRLKEMGA